MTNQKEPNQYIFGKFFEYENYSYLMQLCKVQVLRLTLNCTLQNNLIQIWRMLKVWPFNSLQ